MDHLVEQLNIWWLLLTFIFLAHTHALIIRTDEEASQELAHVIEAGCLTSIELNEALLFLILPHPSRAILRNREKGCILRVEVNTCDNIGMSQKTTEYIVIV